MITQTWHTPIKALMPYFSTLIPDVIPAKYRDKTFIAGSAVLNLTRASDVDVFIVTDGIDMPLAMQEITVALTANEISWSDEKSSDKGAIKFDLGIGREINLIVDEALNIEGLLDSFDISTSRWAIDYKGNLIQGNQATRPGEPITVFYNSRTTVERIKKYLERFGTGYKGRRRDVEGD